MAERRPKRDGGVVPPASPLQGQRLVQPVLRRSRDCTMSAERDHAGNRKLFYDQYVTLLLMYFATPPWRASARPRPGHGLGENPADAGHRTPRHRVALQTRVFDAERLGRSSRNWRPRPCRCRWAARPRRLKGLPPSTARSSPGSHAANGPGCSGRTPTTVGSAPPPLRRPQGSARRCDPDPGGVFRRRRARPTHGRPAGSTSSIAATPTHDLFGQDRPGRARRWSPAGQGLLNAAVRRAGGAARPADCRQSRRGRLATS